MDDDLRALDAQLKHLYSEHYLPWCIEERVMQPLDYSEFRSRLLEHAIEHIADEMMPADSTTLRRNKVTVARNPSTKKAVTSFFIADRVSKKSDSTKRPTGGPHNHEASVIRKCDQCHSNVWVAKDALKNAEKAEGIICTECLPEMTGLSVKEFMDMLPRSGPN